MLRASELRGRAVIDLDAAEKIGYVRELVLDPDHARVAAFLISDSHSLLGNHPPTTIIPATCVHALGQDALTIHAQGATTQEGAFSALPRMSHVIGRKMVSHSGKLLGSIDDVLLDPESGQILGYAFANSGTKELLSSLFGGKKESNPEYVRGDAELRVGKDVIVVPDDAVMSGHPSQSSVNLASQGAGSWGQRPRIVESRPPAGTNSWVIRDEPLP